MATPETRQIDDIGISKDYKYGFHDDRYQYGFHDDHKPTFKSRKGLDEKVINQMSKSILTS
jgi:hypothetical protein